jgi:hypothetical protein
MTERDRVDVDYARLTTIVRPSEDAIMSLDGDLRITSWNHGALFRAPLAPRHLGLAVSGSESPELAPSEKGVERGLHSALLGRALRVVVVVGALRVLLAVGARGRSATRGLGWLDRGWIGLCRAAVHHV